MVTGDFKRIWKVLENANTRMMNTVCFTVHHLLRANYFAAKSFTNGLMSQANTQHRQPGSEVADQFSRDARLGRRSGRHVVADPRLRPRVPRPRAQAFVAVPPKRDVASIRHTDEPSLAQDTAAAMPAAPAPTTTTS